MTKKFHCGRLVKSKNGKVKKLELIYGGGTRDCSLSHIDMGFDEVHDIIRGLFKLDKSDCKTELYDFQCQKLDTKIYPTFLEYVSEHGLNYHGTILYLCSEEENENSFISSSPEKRTNPIRTKQKSVQVENGRVCQVEADSSTLLIKIEDSPRSTRLPTNQQCNNCNTTKSPRIYSSTSFSNYSFQKGLNELVDYLRNLINQYNHENIFVQLFEHMCTIRGLSSINLDRLKEQCQPGNENQNQIYQEILGKIDQLSRSFKVLIELNKIKISHIDQHSVIMNSFIQFHQNFQILHDQLTKNLNNSRQSISNRSTSTSMNPKSSSQSHSETHSRKFARPISLSPQRSSSYNQSEKNTSKKARIQSPTRPDSSSSKSSRNHLDKFSGTHARVSSSSSSTRHSSSSRHHSDTHHEKQTQKSSSSSSSSRNHSEVDSRKETPRSSSSSHRSSSQYHSENSRKPVRRESSSPHQSSSSHRTRSQTNSHEQTQRKTQSSSNRHSSSSSSRNHSESNSRAQTSSRSNQQSSSRRINEEDKDKRRTLFDDILKWLEDFLKVLHRIRFTSFANLVQPIINEIQKCRSNIKFSEHQSLLDVEKIIASIEHRLAERMADETRRAAPAKVDGNLEYVFNNTLDSIARLLKSLSDYKSELHKNKQPRRTCWSSPNHSSFVEQKNVDIKPIINLNQHDKSIEDDQSSEASHSSLGDEILMEVARDAYEKRFNRSK